MGDVSSSMASDTSAVWQGKYQSAECPKIALQTSHIVDNWISASTKGYGVLSGGMHLFHPNSPTQVPAHRERDCVERYHTVWMGMA